MQSNVKVSPFEALLSKNVPHVHEKIFLALDYKSFKRCIEVSRVWHNLLTSESYSKKGKSVFHAEILKDGVELWYAAWMGDKDKALRLLETGMMDVNKSYQFQNDSWTPLIMAAHLGHTAIVQLLIEWGADLNKADRSGMPPLHHAAIKGELDTVQLLINSGAETQLSKAAKNGECILLQVLLQAGANPNITELNGEFPLLLAARNCQGKEGIKFWHLATMYRVVQLLLQRGANPNMRDQYGTTPLHWAARFGHKAIVKQLIDGGADPNSRNIWGQTPLYEAVQGGNKAVVKFLVDIGAEWSGAGALQFRNYVV